MAILRYLAIHADCVVTREELFAKFWPNQIVTADALNRVMSNIRRALGDLSNNPQYIATVRNQGYRLIAPVTVLVDPRINQHQLLAQQEPAKPSANETQSRSLWFTAITAMLVLSLLIIFVFNRVNPQRVTLDNLQRITYDQPQNIMPALSPSGENMVYIAKHQGLPNQLMMLKNAPLGAVRLGEQGHHYSYPVFGHDDDTVAAIGQRASEQGPSQHQLVIFSLAEGHQTPVSLLSLKRPGQGLSWHPQQDLLAYSDVHPISGKTVIFTVQRQLKQSRILTDAGAGIEDQQAVFSPDGNQIAFIRHFARYEQALFITDLQGNSRRISSNYSRILSYVWLTTDELLLSLDSGLIKVSLSGSVEEASVMDVKPAFMAYHQPTQRLVFSQINHSAQIATYALADSKVKGKVKPQAGHLLTQSQTRDDEGSISNNGYNLAFVSDRSGQFQIWLRSGNRLSPLKSTTADYIDDLRWSPDGKTLAAISKTATDYFLLLYQLDSQLLQKQSMGQQAINLIDWQSNQSLLFSQAQQGQKQWQLWQYDLNLKQADQLTRLDVYQARLTPDKRRLAFINSQTTDIWLYDWQDTPLLLSKGAVAGRPLKLARNWFVDNLFLYYLTPLNDFSQTQLWRLDFNSGQRQKLTSLPALDLNSRPQKQLYHFTASQRRQLVGDIWSVDVKF